MKTQTNTNSTKVKPQPNIKALVDRLALIEGELDSVDARRLIKESDAIKKTLREYIAEAGYVEDNPVHLLGDLAEVEFGPSSSERVVTEKGKLKKYLGSKMYDQLATFSIKELEKHLSKSQIANVVSEYYGARRIASMTILERPLH